MQQALRSVLFAEEGDSLPTRHPVHAVQPSAEMQAEKSSKSTVDGRPAQSFRSLLRHLGAVVKNECVVKGRTDTFELTTGMDPLQERVFALLEAV